MARDTYVDDDNMIEGKRDKGAEWLTLLLLIPAFLFGWATKSYLDNTVQTSVGQTQTGVGGAPGVPADTLSPTPAGSTSTFFMGPTGTSGINGY